MQSNTLQGKQQYLREKIIDAGHDPQQFVEFCSSKHNLDDLENWSLNELIEIVQAFLNHTNPIMPHQPPTAESAPPKTENTVESVFQPATVENVGQNILGLVLTDDDWSILLSTPTLVGNKPEEKVEKTHQDPPLNINFTFPLLEPQKEKVELSSKDSPLSPPSIQHKPINPSLANSEPQKNEINEITFKEHVRIQRKGEKRAINQSTTAINLSNIMISTAKQKPLIVLPNITQVSVIKTEQVTRNFLQGDYTLYYICFSPIQFTIQRKFSDLIRLRGILQRLFPFLRLPYLQPEGWLSSSEGKDPETLIKYKWMVEEFIRYIIVKSEQLKQSEIVRFFCGLTKKEYSKDEFRKKLEAYENVPRPKFIGEVILTNNILTIPPTPPADRFNISTSTLIGEIDVQYERLRRQLDYLFTNYDLLIKSYSDISATFSTIQNLVNKYQAENEGPKEFKAFSSLQEMVVRLANKINADSEMFRNKIKNLFRFEKQNMATLREVIDFGSNIHYQYSRQGSPPLSSNKVKGCNMEIQSALPLEDPIKNNKAVLAVQEIFWSFASRRQGRRYWQHLRKKLNECLTLIAYDELDSQNENLNFWNGIIKRCVL